MRVSVIGGSSIDDETAEVAREVGRLLGERGHTLVCGGLGGVMASACEGAREAERSEASLGASGERKRPASREADRREASDGASGRTDRREGRHASRAVETIGILPTTRRADANEWVTTPIATGLGNARNPLVVLNGDAVIAIDGAAGTLSELGHALDYHRPVAGLDTHGVDLEGFRAVESPRAAVDYVESAVNHR
ncbi:Rossmann fold nucleotide-binding protein [Halobacteriales archaeon QS_1_69_70]|nr:MAG: Rossmann fold nucleotide-binding protein [Halobacteriales archaeon QS_1_69_70]